MYIYVAVDLPTSGRQENEEMKLRVNSWDTDREKQTQPSTPWN